MGGGILVSGLLLFVFNLAALLTLTPFPPAVGVVYHMMVVVYHVLGVVYHVLGVVCHVVVAGDNKYHKLNTDLIGEVIMVRY